MKYDIAEERMDKKSIIIEQYLDRIKAQICKISDIDEFIDALRQDLYDYEESHPDCTEEDLESEFGTPEDIAEDYLQGHPFLQPRKVMRGKRIRNIIIAVLAVALIAGGFVFADFLSHRQVKATDVIVIEE